MYVRVATFEQSGESLDETIEQVGNRFTRPGLCHRDPEAADVTQRGGSAQEVMVMGVDGQNG